MTEHWERWLWPIGVLLAAIVLALLDLVDDSMSHWFGAHAFLTDTTSGLLVVLITVLFVDQVVRRRQLQDRAQAIAAQAAILGGQAIRTSRAVLAVLEDDGDREASVDELRTYMTMLLIAAPVLIDAAPSRAFLEDAQWLGGVLARVTGRRPDGSGQPMQDGAALVHEAGDRLRTSAQPLLAVLDASQRTAVAEATGTAETLD